VSDDRKGKVIKNKLAMIKLAQTLGNISQACKVMGYSKDSTALKNYMNRAEI
jgi:hypothetical protein